MTMVPLAFLSVITLTAGYMSIRDIFWPLTKSPNVMTYTQGYVDSIAMAKSTASFSFAAIWAT